MVDTSSALPVRAGTDPLAVVREPVNALLDDFLAGKQDELVAVDDRLAPVVRAVRDLVLAGGKRMRAAFVYWGYRASGAVHTDQLWPTAAAFELLQSFALIHDDVMDRSTQRRGQPAVHVALSAHHRATALRGDGDWFGVGGAILAGDLAFVWADELFDTTPVATVDRERARHIFTELRTELMAGQYLDLLLAASVEARPGQAQRVALLKAGRYTVTRPLQLGAALAGVDPHLDAALVDYGDAVGVAFQLRDDVLGLFGDPGDMGKGVLDDLRQGKRTMLMLEALTRADAAERRVLDAVLGDADVTEGDAQRVCAIVVECGALDHIERRIEHLRERALTAIRTVPAPAREALVELADRAVYRNG